MRPSALDTIFDVTTTTSPSATVAARGDQRGDVVAGLDLGQALDADDLHGAARYRRRATWSRERAASCSTPMRGGPSTGSTSPTSRTTGPSPTGTVRVAFDRPEVRNAFRPHTVDELYQALDHARMSTDVGCVLLTGNGPSPKDGVWAFCSGGDQRIRGRDGYKYASSETAESIEPGRAGRLHILEVQRLIRFMPKVVICVVPGWAAGGGHSLHVVCDLTLASAEHARFKQTDADVASFDGGFGSAYLARQVGQKFAREIFFLGREYSRRRLPPHGRGQRRRAPRRAGGDGAGVGGGDQRQEPDRPADAEVRLQPRSTTASSASSCSPARPLASPTAPTRRRRVATPSSRSARRTGPALPYHY